MISVDRYTAFVLDYKLRTLVKLLNTLLLQYEHSHECPNQSEVISPTYAAQNVRAVNKLHPGMKL